jgi:uncharacterized protein (TIGR02246 family)
MNTDPRSEAEVRETIDAMFQAYQRKDIRAIMSVMSPEPGALSLGTGVDEEATGPEQLRAAFQRDFSQSQSVTISRPQTLVWVRGEVAWAVAKCDWDVTADGQQVAMHGMRVTFVLEQWGGRWIIQHFHFSMPAAGQANGHSFPVKECALSGV